MNTALWIVQGLLAFIFFMAGFIKLTRPKNELKEKMGDWVDTVSSPVLKLIGLLEFLGAFGLILPMGLDVLPILTPFAAIGLGFTMAVALIIHLQRRENEKAGVNLVLFVFTVFVAVGRFTVSPVI